MIVVLQWDQGYRNVYTLLHLPLVERTVEFYSSLQNVTDYQVVLSIYYFRHRGTNGRFQSCY